MPFDSMRALMREKVKPIFGSKSNGNKSGYQPISSPTITSQPGHKKRRVSPKTPLPLLTYSASGGCPTRHRPDLARHNSSDEDVTAYMQKKVDFLMRNSDERGWRVMAHYSVGHGKTLTFPMQSEKINNLLTELEALVMEDNMTTVQRDLIYLRCQHTERHAVDRYVTSQCTLARQADCLIITFKAPDVPNSSKSSSSSLSSFEVQQEDESQKIGSTPVVHRSPLSRQVM